MFYCDRSTQLLLFSCLLGFLSTFPTSAQITPDNTLGDENSIVTNNVTIKDAIADLIEGGAIRDNNLFHSFSEFNVPDSHSVYFASPDGIANILTRVTGNNISEIFGTLGVLKDTASYIDGAANLFLLNPNGIVFGENASLDVNGSFIATTADSYIFSEETKFSATEPDTAPLLSINLIPGLQMGSNSGNITVQGGGHLLTGGVFFPLRNNSTVIGLQVKNGQTLGLIGGDIDIDGGVLQIPGGNIQLSSVREGNIGLSNSSQGWRLDTSQVKKFGDINLNNRALIDASGIIAGNIKLQGKNINFKDASAAIIQNLGSETSGKIVVDATDSVRLSGSLRNAPDVTTPLGNITGVAVSRLITESLSAGQGGDIVVLSDNLLVDDGGFISARSFSNASTGNIDLAIDGAIEINGFPTLNPSIPTLIGTTIFSSGDSGEINISAQNINVSNGATISSLNFGSGRGGNLTISIADELKISSFNKIDGTPSTFGSTTYRTGNSGNVNINTSRLSLQNGGKLSTASLAEGSAGKLTVNASEYIKISGTIPNKNFYSSIASDVQIVDAVLQQIIGVPAQPTGNSGNIILNTPELIVSDGGIIAVSNQGLGDSGNLNINSDRIILDSDASITAFSASGQGGNIDLQVTEGLTLNKNSAITAQTTGKTMGNRSNVNGGNININAEIITLLEDSQINANAREGNGGNINITTEGLFISTDSLVSASSEFGLDGNVNIETLNGERPIELKPLPIAIVDATQQITASCSVGNDKFAIAGQGGLPENPTQNLRGQTIWQDLRMLKDDTAKLTANFLLLPGYPYKSIVIEAQTWRVNPQGKVELMAIKSNNSRSIFSHNTPQCSQITSN